jgi:Recombinase zinc beta ribbon domain
MQLKIMLSAERFAGRRKARKYLLTGRVYCGKCGFSLNGETKRDQPGRPLRPVYHCRVQGDTQRIRGCGGVTVNASALDWYIRESVFSRLVPGQFADLLRDAAPNDDKLKQLLDRRAAQQLRIGGLSMTMHVVSWTVRNWSELSRALQPSYRASTAKSSF